MTTFEGPLWEAIGMAILHLLWQGAVIAALLAIALRLLSRSSAAVRYAVSCIALAALVVFGVATAIHTYEPGAPPLVVTSPAQIPASIAAALEEPASPGTLAIIAATLRLYSPNIALLWLAGVVVLAARLAMSWSRTRELARTTVPADDRWQRVVAHLCDRLGIRRVVRLVESAAVEVPSVVGFLKPVVLVPASSLSGLSPQQLEMILAHELAHVRRHDFFVNMLQSVAETLLFYHPATWWISRQIRIERENCCDDLAVATCGSAIDYARALTALEELRVGPSLAVAANGGSLLNRVRRLVIRRERGGVNGWTAIAAAISFAVVMMVTSLPLRADREAPAEVEPAASEIDVVAPPAPEAPPHAAAPPAPAMVPAPEDPPLPPNPPDPDGFDYDIDIDIDTDLDLPELAPVVAPGRIRVRPAIAPRPPGTPAPPLTVALAAIDDEKLEVEIDEEPSTADEPLRADGRLSVDELIALRIHNVTPQYITEMRSLFGNLTLRQITALRTMGVTPGFVSDLRAAGVNITTAKEAITLRNYNVSPEFVRSLAAAGYSKLTIRDLVRLAAAGVNADFIRDLQKYRDNK